MRLWACVDSEDHGKFKSVVRGESPPEYRQDGWNIDEGCVLFSEPCEEDDEVAAVNLACQGVAPGTCREIAMLDLLNWKVEYVGPVLDGKPKRCALAEAVDTYFTVNWGDGWRALIDRERKAGHSEVLVALADALDAHVEPAACPVLAEDCWDQVIVVHSDASWSVYRFSAGSEILRSALYFWSIDTCGPPGSWPSAEGGAR